VRLVWHVFIGLVLVNLLAAGGFVGWMYLDGRINRERIEKVVETFKLTIDQEKALLAQAEQIEEENRKMLEQQVRLESIADGPQTLKQRLEQETKAKEIALERLKFYNQQNEALREEMARFQREYDRRLAELDQQRAEFEQWVKQQEEETRDENFQQVVALYQTQPAKQTKQAFQALIQQGKIEQVVSYLAAMSSRKAGQVLAQFKTPAEVTQAAELLERLRLRGHYTLLGEQNMADSEERS